MTFDTEKKKKNILTPKRGYLVPKTAALICLAFCAQIAFYKQMFTVYAWRFFFF